MRLLLDQNISYRLVRKIAEYYPNVKQVRELNLENFSDAEIWKYAKENDYTIVTFDSDFYDIANIKGHPPKIIWLRVGNTTTKNMEKLFLEKFMVISNFILNTEYVEIACLELH